MKEVEITGTVVSQPVVIADKDCAIVMLCVATEDGYIELNYQHTIHSCIRSMWAKFANSKFSAIALSAIGDVIEAKISYSTGNINSFRNKTRGTKWL